MSMDGIDSSFHAAQTAARQLAAPEATGLQASSASQSRGMDAQKRAKLADGAHQFEAMMLQEMLKPLHFGAADASGDGEESSGGASDTIRGFATDAISKALASKGGVGIAGQIIRQVSAEQDRLKAGKLGTKVW